MNSERFNGANAAMLLIDHQIGTMGWVRSAPLEEIKKNTLVLAKAARALNMPVILTSSMEDHVQGPLMLELQAILPEAFAARVKRLASLTLWMTRTLLLPFAPLAARIC